MKHKHFITAFASFILAAAVSPIFAQKEATGLDSLDEQRVMGELSDRGMESVLKREFEVTRVPTDVQNGILSRNAIRRLSDPGVKAAEREGLLKQVVAGIEKSLPTMRDPKALMQTAKVLVTSGIDPDINKLEYWGENPKTQARVKPLVDAVVKIYTKAETEAQKAEDDLANKIAGPSDDAGAKRWQDMDDLHGLVVFSQQMTKYDQAIVLPRGNPDRKKIADDAIDQLKNFDVNDNNVQALVRNAIGKLHMVAGDFDEAKKIFQTVITNPNGDIKPAPSKGEQYVARYFSLVSDILANRLDDAEKNIGDLQQWEDANFPDKQAHDGVAAALAMLKYRIASSRSDAADGPMAKTKYNDQAIAVLMQLVQDQPGYKTVVFEQVMTRLPANPDLTTLDPLLLLALQNQGMDEFRKPDTEKVDDKAMDRAIAAAREIISRKKGVDAQTAANSAYTICYYLQRQGKKADAAGAFLDYAKNFPNDPAKANDALDHATALIAEMRKADITDQDAKKLYDRFLPIAIQPPFNRKQFAFEYALLLQRTQHYKEAIEYFKKVEPGDPRYLQAQFSQMVALKQRINDDNDKMEPAERGTIMSQIQTLADEVNKSAGALETSSNTVEEKKKYTSMLVRTALLAADLANHEQKDPRRALDMMNGFEDRIKGMPNADALETQALTLRVNAYMATGQSDKATQTLVQLINTAKDKNTGPAMVFDLLGKLNADMDHAKAIHDPAQVAQIAQNRASLTGFLVTWADGNPDPKIKELAPKYRIMDASTKQLAAELSDDAAKKKAGLEAALKQYQTLNDPNNPDPHVTLGIGEVQYDLGNYKEAQDALSPLVLNKLVGGPTVTVDNNGTPEVKDNNVYWETVYKLLSAINEVGKKNPNDADAQKSLEDGRTFLKQIYVLHSKSTGGSKFHADFEKLRAEMVPDFKPPENEEATTTEPST